ncbi:MAG: ribosome maturation factor RimP [Gammaproteobacteria bacterium]
MHSAPDRLKQLIGRVAEPMGYELVGIEYRSGADSGLLRIYIDREGGIQLDDCVAVSRQVSAMLDVEDPLKEAYQLEVSSPGVDRPLFVKEHFERFAGSRVRVKLRMKMHGRRRFEGVLQGVQDDNVVLEMDGEMEYLPLDQIDSARLVPEF